MIRETDFHKTSGNYELVSVGKFAVAYKLKASLQEGNPEHYFCPNCWLDGMKSYLMPIGVNSQVAQLKCFKCNSEMTAKVPPKVRAAV